MVGIDKISCNTWMKEVAESVILSVFTMMDMCQDRIRAHEKSTTKWPEKCDPPPRNVSMCQMAIFMFLDILTVNSTFFTMVKTISKSEN